MKLTKSIIHLFLLTLISIIVSACNTGNVSGGTGITEGIVYRDFTLN